ncbi:MAG: diguanylate phosphodiesterase [Frankiales bacterium]|nr:diguanylate phosphodiesterase [Frankiales bacterium]
MAPTPHPRHRGVGLLLVAVAVEVALAATERVAAVRRFAGGDHSPRVLAGVLGLVSLVVLLVATRRAAQALTEDPAAGSRTDFAAVATTSWDWMWQADAQMCLTETSAQVNDVLGYSAEELRGRSAYSLLADEPSRRALAEAVEGGSGWTGLELVWVHRDGHLVVTQGNAVPVKNAGGALVGFRGTRRMVTAAMTTARSLQAARYRIDELIDGRHLDIALQPVIDLRHGRLTGVEALARFRDGRSPDTWFAEAAETGQALALDRLALQTALQRLPSLPEHVSLSINATPELILDPLLSALLTGDGIDLGRIILEITEHVAIPQYDDIRAALLPLRERGMRLAVDDTGAGYASMNHVLQLRPDIIKIDRSLVATSTSDPARRSVITALVLLALDLGACVVAEGIETPSELETVGTLGVDQVQGYLLARPTTDPTRWQRWWDRNWLFPTTDPQATPTAGAALQATMRHPL